MPLVDVQGEVVGPGPTTSLVCPHIRVILVQDFVFPSGSPDTTRADEEDLRE